MRGFELTTRKRRDYDAVRMPRKARKVSEPKGCQECRAKDAALLELQRQVAVLVLQAQRYPAVVGYYPVENNTIATTTTTTITAASQWPVGSATATTPVIYNTTGTGIYPTGVQNGDSIVFTYRLNTSGSG